MKDITDNSPTASTAPTAQAHITKRNLASPKRTRVKSAVQRLSEISPVMYPTGNPGVSVKVQAVSISPTFEDYLSKLVELNVVAYQGKDNGNGKEPKRISHTCYLNEEAERNFFICAKYVLAKAHDSLIGNTSAVTESQVFIAALNYLAKALEVEQARKEANAQSPTPTALS